MTLVSTPIERLSEVSASAVSSPAAETAIVTSDVVSAQSGRITKVTAYLNITAGTGTTAFVIRCRQGAGTGGALLTPNSAGQVQAAGNTEQVTIVFRDTSSWPAQAGGGAYTVTVAQTGNTVAGTVNDAYITVDN